MTTLIPNSFSTYKLTEEEELQGMLLSTAQKQCIQNKRAEAAELKLALTLDPDKIQGFLQSEAFAAGQIAAYTTLLEDSDIAQETQLNVNSTSL